MIDCARSALPLHDDPVSAARHHARRTLEPQSLTAGGGAAAGGAAAAAVQEQQQHLQQAQLALQQQRSVEDLSTLVLYIFSPTDPGGQGGTGTCNFPKSR